MGEEKTAPRRTHRPGTEAAHDLAAAERHRIGQELHDDVGQELVALGLMAADLVERLRAGGGPEVELAARVRDAAHHTLTRLRAATRELAGPDLAAADLAPALAALAGRVREAAGVGCTFEGPGRARVPDGWVATHLYRIAQEAVANALKHASPAVIAITLGVKDGRTELRVRDDGRGLDPAAPPGLGLRGMRCRAGLCGAALVLEPRRPGTLVRCILN